MNGRASSGPDPVRGPVFPRTKFQCPLARPEQIARTTLLERVGVGDPRLVVVSAPAGFGKTTFLGQWAATRSAAVTAWISVDADDAGPRLWSALLTALRPSLGRSLDDLLVASAAPDVAVRDDVLVGVLDRLAEHAEPVTVVLDDAHLVLDDAETRAALDWFLERLPAPHAVALGSRRALPLAALGRRGIRGELVAVGVDELRFTPTESALFLREGLGLHVDDATVDEIEHHVEGWPAALYLAGLRMRLGGDPLPDAADERPGEATFGVLADEVLGSWPAGHRRFIREVALLDRFTLDMCVRTLRGDEDEVRRAFRELTGTSLLLIPLDRGRTWFRCHHLLRDVLRDRLEDEDPARVRAIRARAGAWLESEGGESELDDALDQYLAAEAWDAAAELLAAHGLRLIGFDGRDQRVRRRLGRFPGEWLRTDARLAYVAALVAAVEGDRDARDAWLATGAAADWQGPMPDGTGSFALAADVVAALVCFDDPPAAVAAADRVLDRLPPAAPVAVTVAAFAAWYLLLDGELDRAEQRADQALSGQMRLPWSGPSVVTPLAQAVHALVALERDAVDAAERAVVAAVAAVRTDPPGNPLQVLPLRVAEASIALRRGRADDAAGVCRSAARQVAGWRDHSVLLPALLAQRATVAAAQGDHAAAADAVGEAEQCLAGTSGVRWLRRALSRVAPTRHADPGAELSDRELDVLRALAGSGSLRDVADGLRISHNTVKTHTRTLYAKLGVGSRRDAVRSGRERGLLGRRPDLRIPQEGSPDEHP